MGTQFFLSRPRRFGKSLLLSTIKCIFEGKRELFEGLAFAQKQWDWEKETCPVILLDMNTCSGEMEKVINRLESQLLNVSEYLGIPLRDSVVEIEDKFFWLIKDAAAKSPTGQVVLLIDEYDKPLAKYIGTPEVKPYQEFLKSFYSGIKSTGHLQRFCLMTGVSKFSKVSIFSELNNLTDITMDTCASTLLGYTHAEVKQYFPESLQALAKVEETNTDGVFNELIENYDGYSFDKTMKRVFNPVSLGKALSRKSIESYWFETGTPSWLMRFAKTSPMMVDKPILSESALGTFEPDNPNYLTVLFQTGYLTIKDVDYLGRRPDYELGFPNEEVADGFNTWLAQTYSIEQEETTGAWQQACKQALREGDTELFIQSLKSFFASIGYDLSDRINEQSYQNITVAILRFIGISVNAEVTTSRGRIDMIASTKEHVFIIEMKIATGVAANVAAAESALTQIKEKGYAESFAMEAASGKRTIHLIGISFDCAIHNIAAWKTEVL